MLTLLQIAEAHTLSVRMQDLNNLDKLIAADPTQVTLYITFSSGGEQGQVIIVPGDAQQPTAVKNAAQILKDIIIELENQLTQLDVDPKS